MQYHCLGYVTATNRVMASRATFCHEALGRHSTAFESHAYMLTCARTIQMQVIILHRANICLEKLLLVTNYA